MAPDAHSRQTSRHYKGRPAHRQPSLRPLAACLGLALALALATTACKDEPHADSTPHGASPLADLPEPDALEQTLDSFDPDAMRPALLGLTRAVDLDARRNPRRDVHRRLLTRAGLDLWLYTRIAETMAASAHEDDIRQRWLDEVQTFGELLELVIVSPQIAPSPATADALQRASDPLGARLALRLRPWLRADLRDPVRGPAARTTLALFDAAAATDIAATLRADRALRLAPDAPLALHANLHLALRADRALDATGGLPLSAHALELARVAGQFCPDGIAALDRATSPDDTLATLRRRCGFGCTDTAALLGLDEPTPLAPIDPACRLEPLPDDTPGQHLALDNFLATHALAEIARLRTVLQAPADDDEASLARVAAPFVQHFTQRLDTTVIPGTLPFIDATGPADITLPRRRWTPAPLQPTPAVALLVGDKLHLVAWPRYGLVPGTAPTAHAVRSLVTDPELALPGAPLVSLDDNLNGATAVDAVRARLDAIAALPWPTPPVGERTAPPTLAVVADAATPAEDLMRAAAVLRDAGIERIVLATWPDGEGFVAHPVASGVGIHIDSPLRPTPVLRLANRDTQLVDTLGRERDLPIFAVQRFLPDVYDAVLDFVRANPAIDELVLEPDPTLDLATLTMAIDALVYRRDGDVMSSTDTLLTTPPLETVDQRPVPLVRTLYLAPAP